MNKNKFKAVLYLAGSLLFCFFVYANYWKEPLSSFNMVVRWFFAVYFFIMSCYYWWEGGGFEVWNHCDKCGKTKSKVYTVEHFLEAGYRLCEKCIDESDEYEIQDMSEHLIEEN